MTDKKIIALGNESASILENRKLKIAKDVQESLGPYFCIVPWTHTYVSPQGERRLCCASREEASFQKQYIDVGEDNDSDFNPVSLEEHWNSDYMKQIRIDMLDGKKIPQCTVCHDQILNLHTYRNYFNNVLFSNKFYDVRQITDDDGAVSELPVSYDYRISNLCNFKCRQCGEQLSSSWEAEKKEHKLIDYKVDKWMEPTTRKKIGTFQKEVLETELQKAVDDKNIEEIYWVGGEPLMWERHWTIMNQLVKSGQSKDVTIRYNTNLSRITYKEYDLFSLLRHFKSVNVCASIDGAGIPGEYIRTGLNWNEWLENFKAGMFLNDIYHPDALVMDFTMTTIGLIHLQDLLLVVKQLGVKSYVKLTFSFDPTVLHSPMCLPRPLLEFYCHKQLRWIKNNFTDNMQPYKDLLIHMMETQTHEEAYNDWYLKGRVIGKKNIERIDNIRGGPKFSDFLPTDIRKWYDYIEEDLAQYE